MDALELQKTLKRMSEIEPNLFSKYANKFLLNELTDSDVNDIIDWSDEHLIKTNYDIVIEALVPIFGFSTIYKAITKLEKNNDWFTDFLNNKYADNTIKD